MRTSWQTGMDPVVALLFTVASALVTPGCSTPVGDPDEIAAIAMVERLGGRVEFAGANTEKRVLKVYLHDTKVRNEDLMSLAKLKMLRNLFLGHTGIDDSGIEILGNLTTLETLSLNSTRVTDESLKSLSRLKQLKTLNLQDTSVTKPGVAVLGKSLPRTTIAK